MLWGVPPGRLTTGQTESHFFADGEGGERGAKRKRQLVVASDCGKIFEKARKQAVRRNIWPPSPWDRKRAEMAMADSILNYEKDPKEDYYGILGCDKSSTTEQIMTEFKVRAKQLHPDKSDDPECEEKFKLLHTVSGWSIF